MTNKSENIAEYILQTWQMEDLIRAFHDDEALETNTYLRELKQMMQTEGVMLSGHVQLAQIAVQELDDLHRELYDTEAPYRAAWLQLMPAITVLKSKTDDPAQSDMQMCLTFLYEIMLLRMQKRPISSETTAVQQQVSRLLAFLSAQYKETKYDHEEEI